MGDANCGVCNSAPKKYKCPTCALPYCSITCFKEHKTTHPEDAPAIAPSTPVTEVNIPKPPTPEPLPKYLRQKTDFSQLATNTKFQGLLKSQPTLLSTLQRVYAATIEPDADNEPPARGMRGRAGFRGRRGDRGRGRGGRGGWIAGDERPKWTPKKGDKDAMRMLKGLREGKRGEKEKEDIGQFVALLEDIFMGDTEMEDAPGA